MGKPGDIEAGMVGVSRFELSFLANCGLERGWKIDSVFCPCIFAMRAYSATLFSCRNFNVVCYFANTSRCGFNPLSFLLAF